LENRLAEATNEKLYKAEYVGSGTFIISKPKRKKPKQRQSRLKNPNPGSRK
jgi:preprotein translocase subunit YajC